MDQRAECGFRFESGSPGPTPQSARARRMQQALHKGRSLGPDFEPTFLGRRRDFLFEPLELTRRRQTNGQSVLHARPQDRGGSRLRSRGAQIGRARERGESVRTRAASDHEAPFSPRISGLEIHPETGFRERRDRKREGRRGLQAQPRGAPGDCFNSPERHARRQPRRRPSPGAVTGRPAAARAAPCRGGRRERGPPAHGHLPTRRRVRPPVRQSLSVSQLPRTPMLF